MVPEILSATDRFFFHFGPLFVLLPLTTQNIKILKRFKKRSRYYHFKHEYSKLQPYDIWFLRHRAQQTEFFITLDNFLPIYPLKTQKVKISKKWKKHLEISSFYTSAPKIMVICYTVPEIWHMTDVIVIFHFGLFFALSPPPLTAQKMKISKKWKKHRRYHRFTQVSQKSWSYAILFQRYGAWQM